MAFRDLSIRMKLTLVMTLLLAIMSVGVYLYFPARFKAQAVESAIKNAAALTEMTATSIADGVDSRDPTAIAEVLASLRRNPDVIYLVVLAPGGEQVASFNPLMADQVDFTAIPHGPLRTPYSIPHADRIGDDPSSAPAPAGIEGGESADGTIYQVVTPVREHGRDLGMMYVGISLDAIQTAIARSRATVALVTLIAFMAGVVAVFFLSTLIVGPLQRIAQTAERIADGDLSQRADVGAQDEVGQLARAFNQMVDRLNGAREQLRQWSRTLEQRVEERTRALQDEVEERRRAVEALLVSEERYRLLFERNLAGVYIATSEGRIVSCNETCARIFGYESPEALIAARATVPYRSNRIRGVLAHRLREEGAVLNEEVEIETPGEPPKWILENVRLVEGESEGATLEGIVLDITERKRAEEKMVFRAYHDVLTGLPNRSLFLDRLNVQLAHAERQRSAFAVLFIDLDDMKVINDTLGHSVGDEMLKVLAHRLSSTLRRGDSVARVGGDEFLILLSSIHGEADAERVANKIQERFSEPFIVDEEEVHVTASIGCALYPSDGDDADALIRNADGAMYRVKETGGNGVELCSRTARRGLGRLSLEQQIRSALDRDEFEVYFQPQVSVATGELSGAEALVRWKRPDQSVVDPAGFVTVAEQTGLITPIGDVVLRKACAQMERWRASGIAPPRLAVNVSVRQFYQRDFIGSIERVLSDTSYAPSGLELEITESVAVQKTDRSRRMLQQLRSIGISIAIDDFGTGQSSLTYLRRFEIDAVKIDKSFVYDIERQSRVDWIINAVLVLATQLSLRTCAEGVETDQQLSFLAEHGCTEAQGYLISPPLPAAVFEERFLGGGSQPERIRFDRK